MVGVAVDDGASLLAGLGRLWPLLVAAMERGKAVLPEALGPNSALARSVALGGSRLKAGLAPVCKDNASNSAQNVSGMPFALCRCDATNCGQAFATTGSLAPTRNNWMPWQTMEASLALDIAAKAKAMVVCVNSCCCTRGVTDNVEAAADISLWGVGGGRLTPDFNMRAVIGDLGLLVSVPFCIDQPIAPP